MIEAIKITKYFSDKAVLNDVSFSVRSGEICGYIGPNGAGKTTTIKILTGIIKPSSGFAYIDGISVTENPNAVKKIIGYVPESGAVFETLTPIEFLTFIGRIYQMKDSIIEKKISELMEIFEIYEYRNEPMLSFSKGMKQKVILISALMHDPKVLLLDEPLNGLDANSIQIFKEIIKKLAENGRTIFYSSHLLDVIEKICDKLIIINHGKIIASGTLDEILKIAGVLDLNDAFAKLTGSENLEMKLQNFINKIKP
ncbi:ABC-2 type transport system ATP-binding protein [Candidatus Kryptonium thompsonii]|jgi:ABC-2 type transport system ATP-binding protein|uniref:ABC-2 type transport system ATP-binding protein n=2 Tax=Candidatus Kryptonium thompsonii TaxID=1633631 RepID=A0A0P1MDG7_9BACT|nr:ABC transporter ATP-binding protein [Candidatus Kryptonium thompsoni]CUS77438.1 ABC-2 type transport system ATP-binding protein [Candidatus Kryptonium thompsoni]CUS86089.1 ABC-2 type transport system ATP-binding protein [Candidatus Kryptonium thompsoni]CUS91680.1 ABC-2 type transport system ATP-binding protein [Candidatus Kryptonium thompsoni]CUS93126.1 ABC-2 type transport system ATP-binding protein [Candidatus Kryptonium thompsoni]CUS97574.1 ABC-2 type transport system ATP-binding protein